MRIEMVSQPLMLLSIEFMQKIDEKQPQQIHYQHLIHQKMYNLKYNY